MVLGSESLGEGAQLDAHLLGSLGGGVSVGLALAVVGGLLGSEGLEVLHAEITVAVLNRGLVDRGLPLLRGHLLGAGERIPTLSGGEVVALADLFEPAGLYLKHRQIGADLHRVVP